MVIARLLLDQTGVIGMEVLEGLWMLYVDGYAFTHLVSVVWMVNTNMIAVLMVVGAFFRHEDRRRYRC
jgi:hypothetical protein